MNVYTTYNCNANCGFCSIKNNAFESRLDLGFLENELDKHKDLCKNINILGGEPSILPDDYQDRLISICEEHGNLMPYYITNLIKISSVINRVDPIISFDFTLRHEYRLTISNMLKLNVDFSISTILTNNLVENIGAEEYLKFIHRFRRCKRADLVVYFHAIKDAYNYTPRRDKLLRFVEQVMHDSMVSLAPLQAMKGIIPIHSNDMADFMAFLPYNKLAIRLQYNNVSPYRVVDNYEEAKRVFYNGILQNNICKKCKFANYCWYPNTGDKCHGDYEMMEMFENEAKKIIR